MLVCVHVYMNVYLHVYMNGVNVGMWVCVCGYGQWHIQDILAEGAEISGGPRWPHTDSFKCPFNPFRFDPFRPRRPS